MKKVVRLTESKLVRLIEKIIHERKFDAYDDYLETIKIIEDTVEQTESIPQSKMENYLRKLISIKYDIKEDDDLDNSEKKKLLTKLESAADKISKKMSELDEY